MFLGERNYAMQIERNIFKEQIGYGSIFEMQGSKSSF